MPRRHRTLSALAALALLPALAGGCGQQDAPLVTPQSLQATTQAQITAIQNNPNMPAQAKQAAIARLQQNLQIGASQVGKH